MCLAVRLGISRSYHIAETKSSGKCFGDARPRQLAIEGLCLLSAVYKAEAGGRPEGIAEAVRISRSYNIVHGPPATTIGFRPQVVDIRGITDAGSSGGSSGSQAMAHNL